MKIIAFGHRRRMGKSTCAKLLLSHYRTQDSKLHTHQFGFADKVKALAHQMYVWGGLQDGIYYENHPELKEQILPDIGQSPRDIWIKFGEFGRAICSKTWAELGLQGRNCDILICYDLRDSAEARYVKDAGGYVVRVNRPGVPIFDDSADCGLDKYADWDGYIENDGSLRDLNNKIKTLSDLIEEDVRGFSL